jgi:hypothetical protein
VRRLVIQTSVWRADVTSTTSYGTTGRRDTRKGSLHLRAEEDPAVMRVGVSPKANSTRPEPACGKVAQPPLPFVRSCLSWRNERACPR